MDPVLKTVPTVFQVFAGIAVVVPVRDKMRHPESMGSLIVCAMVFMAILNWSLGFFGSLYYGDKLKKEASIVMALPTEEW